MTDKPADAVLLYRDGRTYVVYPETGVAKAVVSRAGGTFYRSLIGGPLHRDLVREAKGTGSAQP